MKIRLVATIGLIVASNAGGQEKPQAKPECPIQAHMKMNERGEQGMGFSRAATTHHFYLKPDGGIIQVEANDPGDTTNRDKIRMHLEHIAQAFSNGDFDIPMFVHDTVPPRVLVMKRMKNKIQYKFEELPDGGRVVMTSSDKESVEAVRGFLRFQIQEHQTGDTIDKIAPAQLVISPGSFPLAKSRHPTQ